MNDVVLLAAARSDSLQSYLKAIAILRLVSNQKDDSIRGAWRNGALELHGISRIDLETFLLDSYQPTPILNPWNSGAGFDPKSRCHTAGKTLDNIAAQSAKWLEYTTALATAREVVAKFKGNTSDDLKRDILIELRGRYSDVALEWLDAAVLIGGTKLAFPTILGTGGNDGRLDFSINFAQRALEVVGSEPLASRDVLLRDALDGAAEAQLVEGIFGQYRLGGGGFINPWDYVFTLEGAIAFAGAVSRRFSSGSDRPTIPFQFEAVAAGYAAASDEEVTRGEIWLPAWRGRATYRAVRSMLRGGRVELVTDQPGVESATHVASGAANSIAAVAAAQTYGVATGIESFGRVVVAQRNGLAFGATYVGRITVADRPEIAALAGETLKWIHRASRLELGAAGRAALRAYNDGMIDYATRPQVATFQKMLGALADLDNAVALTRGDHRPLKFLPSAVFDAIDAMLDLQHRSDGALEHRVAQALTSIGYRHREHRLRYRIGHVAFGNREDVYDAQRRFVWKPDVLDTLAEIFVRIVREATTAPTSDDNGFAARLRGSSGVVLEDLADLLAGAVDWRRIKTLLRAYSIIEPRRPKQRLLATRDQSMSTDSDEGPHASPLMLPVSFAALKTLVFGYRPQETSVDADYASTTYLDSETAYQLVSGKTKPALWGAYARLRSAGADIRDFRLASIDQDERTTFVAALLTPIRSKTAAALQRQIMLERPLSALTTISTLEETE